MNQELMTPEQEALVAEHEAVIVLAVASAIVVTDDEGYRNAGRHYADIKNILKILEARRVAITGPINTSLKLINDGFRRPKETLEKALSFYERPMLLWQQQLDTERRAAEATAKKAKEEAEAAARAVAKAEEDKLIEAHRLLTEARLAAQQADDPFSAVLAEQVVEQMLEDAQSARVVAEEAIRAMMLVDVPEVFVPRATAAGSRVNRPWTYRIVEPGMIPKNFWVVDEKKIGAFVREHKDQAVIPGVEIFQDVRIGGA